MQPEFWHKRWERDQIGFHLPEVNPYLPQFWPGLGLAPGSQVLVPLCGKSLDMGWLAGQGYRVLGVELSAKAVEDFFAEQQVEPQLSQRGAFRVYQAGTLEVWCGDFFALSAEDVAECAAFYDRAALIALPEPMREQYAQHLERILKEGCKGLLITLDYDQSQMNGPPFAVTDPEVQQLFGADWQLRIGYEKDILGESWKFLKGGVTRLDERVYQLSKR